MSLPTIPIWHFYLHMSNAFILPKKAPIFWWQGITAITLRSLHIFLPVYLLFNICQLRSLDPSKIHDVPTWPRTITRLCFDRSHGGELSSPQQTQGTVKSIAVFWRKLQSSTQAQARSCRGFLVGGSAETCSRIFCRDLLIRCLGWGTFSHFDSVFLHSQLFPHPSLHSWVQGPLLQGSSAVRWFPPVLHIIWPKPGALLWGKREHCGAGTFSFASYLYCLRDRRHDCWPSVWLIVSSPGSWIPVLCNITENRSDPQYVNICIKASS